MRPEPSTRDRRKIAIAILVALVVTAIVVALFIARRQNLSAANDRKPPKTRPVEINLLPATLDIPEKTGYSHQFSIPSDAANAHLEGEFTVEPRPQAQAELLLVSAEGMLSWQKFLSSAATPSDPTDADLVYRSGDTIAARFDVRMTPGAYYLLFDFGPVASGTADHFGYGVDGPAYRQVHPNIRLDYDLPCESCP
jgi:hypothetical protein